MKQMTELHETFSHRITLLRHGESSGNAQDVYQGHEEFDLTERGRAQSRVLVTRWQEEGIVLSRIISSPQSRARQTAEIIAKALSIPLEFDIDWQEIDNGALAGLTLGEAAEKHPSQISCLPWWFFEQRDLHPAGDPTPDKLQWGTFPVPEHLLRRPVLRPLTSYLAAGVLERSSSLARGESFGKIIS